MTTTTTTPNLTPTTAIYDPSGRPIRAAPATIAMAIALDERAYARRMRLVRK